MLDIVIYQLANGFKFTQFPKPDNTIVACSCSDSPFPDELELNSGFRIKERLLDGKRIVIERV